MNLPIELFERQPILIVLAGSNGAGKSTFYHAFLRPLALQFVNADLIAKELGIDSHAAAKVATSIREDLVRQRVSFVFETVFSDPAGDKLNFMKEAAESGFTVVLFFIGVSSSATSERRVTQRVYEGGHDVPADKLVSRYPRTLENLRRSLRELRHVFVFDNDNLDEPYRLVAVYQDGKPDQLSDNLPAWLWPLLP